jgi:hypothetical protein
LVSVRFRLHNLLGSVVDMPPDQVVMGRAPLPQAEQLSFDELATLRASDEAAADSVIAEVLALQPDA